MSGEHPIAKSWDTLEHGFSMKTMFIAEAVSKGARSGTVESPDHLLKITLGNPLEEGLEKRGPNPELLFAGAYSACYHGAVMNAAEKLGASEYVQHLGVTGDVLYKMLYAVSGGHHPRDASPPWDRAYGRAVCVDDMGREWQQPYYANNTPANPVEVPK